MQAQQQMQQLPAFAIDLSRMQRRTVTSFYSNLVTRPTGRAVRMGVEQHLVEVGGSGGVCLSILDFSQVRVLDYSCADEIVAKLLLRYAQDDRPVDAYFVAKGLQEHHIESVEAVLERHHLLLVTEGMGGSVRLLGPSTPAEQQCWRALRERAGRTVRDLLGSLPLGPLEVTSSVERLLTRRVAVAMPGETLHALPLMNG
jgi:hypothetical protein